VPDQPNRSPLSWSPSRVCGMAAKPRSRSGAQTNQSKNSEKNRSLMRCRQTHSEKQQGHRRIKLSNSPFLRVPGESWFTTESKFFSPNFSIPYEEAKRLLAQTDSYPGLVLNPAPTRHSQ
jgi:hypothetical protein